MLWMDFDESVMPHLTKDDDASLWRTAVEVIYGDADAICRRARKSQVVRTVIGACSHWLRPHQTRWTADGGFAWPSGYEGSSFSRRGLPEHDWSEELLWDPAEQRWKASKASRTLKQARVLTFRVAIPARTARHKQAAVHTVWKPGTPDAPRRQLLQLYGFRQMENGWECTAYWCPRRSAYNHAATNEAFLPANAEVIKGLERAGG